MQEFFGGGGGAVPMQDFLSGRNPLQELFLLPG